MSMQTNPPAGAPAPKRNGAAKRPAGPAAATPAAASSAVPTSAPNAPAPGALAPAVAAQAAAAPAMAPAGNAPVSGAPVAPAAAPVAQPGQAGARAGSVLTRPLGLEGWEHLEPVVLAALASGDPLLLVGKHGAAKSFLLERLAQALGLCYRFYNASLINYDDLVGIPVPNETQTALRYIATPASIWDAEVVFVDEISRARPELQNKLFPIIHERRVQGIALERLRYRWSAMNPPPDLEVEEDPGYLGSEPLDAALADRFAFIVQVPAWEDLDETAQRAVLLDQFRGRHEFPVPVPELVERTRRVYDAFATAPPAQLCAYLIALAPLAARMGHGLSTRRMTTLLRSMLAVQAARTVLAEVTGQERPGWEDAAWLAFRHGLPTLAQGRALDPAELLAAHRQAWRLAGLEASDPWRQLLAVPDPAQRLALACRLHPTVGETDIGTLLTEALAAQRGPGLRRALALVALQACMRFRLPAIMAASLQPEVLPALVPSETQLSVYGKDLEACREVAAACATLGEGERDDRCRRLLASLLPDGYRERSPAQVREAFEGWWTLFGLPR